MSSISASSSAAQERRTQPCCDGGRLATLPAMMPRNTLAGCSQAAEPEVFAVRSSLIAIDRSSSL